MNKKLFFGAITKFFLGVLIVGALIFIPAGSLNYPNGQIFMALLFIPMFIAGIILMIKNSELLKKRLNAKEKENEQKWIVIWSGLMFLVGFIVAGLDYRYHWTETPNFVVIISSILFLVSYAMYGEVLRDNAYLSRTVGVEKNQKLIDIFPYHLLRTKSNQKLIDTGLYGVVRHPMYAATIVMFLTIPLILGSLISFMIFLMYPVLIVKRIKNEEMVLEKDLEGYAEYKKKVKYKLFPFVW